MTVNATTKLPAVAREFAERTTAAFSQKDDTITFAAFEYAGLVVVAGRHASAADLRQFVAARSGVVQSHGDPDGPAQRQAEVSQ